MKAKPIIAQHKIKDNDYIFRVPQLDDAQALRDFLNEISAEKTFIRRQGVQISLDDEKKYLKDLLSDVNHRLMILVISDGVIVGNAQLTMQQHSDKHLGEVGIMLRKSHRDQGLGTFLMKLLIDEAVNRFSDLEILLLTVFAINDAAIHLYKKLGFQEFGRLPRGIMYKSDYVDRVYMYLDVRDQESK